DSTKLDYETTPSFSLTVQASDGSLSSTATVNVSLTNVVEAPSSAAQSFSVTENTSNSTTVSTVAASFDSSSSAHAFAITAGNSSGAFAIDSTGKITVADSTRLDYETTPTFTLTVQATDTTNSLSSSASVAVNLTNVAEAPSIAAQ